MLMFHSIVKTEIWKFTKQCKTEYLKWTLRLNSQTLEYIILEETDRDIIRSEAERNNKFKFFPRIIKFEEKI